MTRSRPIRIDDDLCTGCGRCISVCPKEILSLCKGKVVPVDQQRCMLCGHCVGACPTGALFLPELDEDASAYETIPDPTGWTGFGEYDICGLVRLMRSRRSCRNYSPRPVEEELLSDLVKIGVTAPSGTNSQKWTFTIIPQREQVLDLGESIAGFFRKLNRAAANPLIRTGLRLIGKPEIDRYYRRHFQSVEAALHDWENRGRDLLFHGAPAVIVVGSRPGASCPVEDALLATQNMLLAAHSLGLGTCLIGYAVEAMRRDRSITDGLGIPREESVHSVIALGYPEEKYVRFPGRKPFVLRRAENEQV